MRGSDIRPLAAGVTESVQRSLSRDQQSAARHLLRALLRESTYLPDANSRTWVKDHVIARFRTYAYTPDSAKATSISSRWPSLMNTSRKALVQLRKANIGDRNAMEKVLHHAYARTGRRRHEILSQLLASSPTLASNTVGSPVLPPLVLALLAAQIATPPPTPARRNPKTLAGLTPDPNSRTVWQKPKADWAVHRDVLRARAALLDSVQVPLPAEEMAFLARAATDPDFVTTMPAIRTPATGEYIARALLLYTDAGDGLERRFRERSISRRYMRRRYAQLLEQCPEARWDEEHARWRVTWGAATLHRASVQKSTVAGEEGVGKDAA